jgi:tetratricopeptide (TPR) repeat protein
VQAIKELARAADCAAACGDEGYETRVISLLLMGYMLPALGQLDDAAKVLDEAICACEERGDLLHLCGGLGNRALVRGYRGDREGTLADFEQAIALGKKLGQARVEIVPRFNLAEYLYYAGDVAMAEPHIAMAAELAKRPSSGTPKEIIDLFLARVKLYNGDIDAARAIVLRIRDVQREAREKQNGLEILSPSEDVLCAMVEIATTTPSLAAWDDIERRSVATSFGQEQIEVIEARALWARRSGDYAEAARCLEKALSLSNRIQTVMGPRLQRELAGMRR